MADASRQVSGEKGLAPTTARAADDGRTTGLPSLATALMSMTSEGVVLFDEMGTILLVNDEAAGLLGTSDLLQGTDVRLAFPPKDAPSGEPGGVIDKNSLPFSLDGEPSEIGMAQPDGTSRTIVVRCRPMRSSQGRTAYALVCHLGSTGEHADHVHDRAVEELRQANHRLAGILRIVLHTLDTEDVGELFGRALQEVADTMQATGTIVYLAERDGFHLRGFTPSLEGTHLARYMPYGRAIETLATEAGHTLRLHVRQPSTDDLRQGPSMRRTVVDEDSQEQHEVPRSLLPPFASFLCVPVWFGGHVISIIEVGWDRLRPIKMDDARLLDSIAQYLSVQLMGAFSAMRARRAEHLEAVASQVRVALVDVSASADGAAPDATALTGVFDLMAEACKVQVAPLYENVHQHATVVRLPQAGPQTLPFALDELEEGHVVDDVAVVPVEERPELAAWLVKMGEGDHGALLDLGSVAGRRSAVLLLRSHDSEPLLEDEVAFLRQCAQDIRQISVGAERRVQDKRISQALQTGMRNELQHVDGITADGIYSSATAEAFVGGDFYDLVRLPERRACVIMGDVSGKGVEAASVSAAVKTALAAYAWEGLTPARMVRSLNDFLMGFSRIETFATLFVGIIDLAAGTLTYCSAGHPPALLLRGNANVIEALDVQSGLVGAFEGMTYTDGLVQIEASDELLLYTDGTTEARNPDGGFFGEDGLLDAVMREKGEGFDGLLDRLLATLDAFTGNSLEDDVAMVALRFDEVG